MDLMQTNRFRALCFSLLPLIAAACGADVAGIAITNVTVVDAVNGVRENQTVVFDGDEITAIRSAGDKLNVAEIIDGQGKFLIPGLWDFHVHLTYDARFTDAMPALFLSYGITSVRDTGGLMHKVLPVVEKMRAERRCRATRILCRTIAGRNIRCLRWRRST